MPKYLVMIHAGNFLMEFEGEMTVHSAFTSRIVKASNELAAVRAAYKDVERRIVEDEAVRITTEHSLEMNTVHVQSVSVTRRVRGYALVLYEEGDTEAEREARLVAEETVGIISGN
jgi:hypothetical protein